MPKSPVPAELEMFLRQPNPAVIATVRADGSVHTAATWYLWEEGRVLVNMDESRKRLEHMREDPRVSITVLGANAWHQHVTLEGRVVSIEPDSGFHGIDRLASNYTGARFRSRDRGRVNPWIEVEGWHAWSGTEPWTA